MRKCTAEAHNPNTCAVCKRPCVRVALTLLWVINYDDALGVCGSIVATESTLQRSSRYKMLKLHAHFSGISPRHIPNDIERDMLCHNSDTSYGGLAAIMLRYL